MIQSLSIVLVQSNHNKLTQGSNVSYVLLVVNPRSGVKCTECRPMRRVGIHDNDMLEGTLTNRVISRK